MIEKKKGEFPIIWDHDKISFVLKGKLANTSKMDNTTHESINYSKKE